jgi:transcription antitermination factor NusB
MTNENLARGHRRASVMALYQLDAGRHDDIDSVADGLTDVDLSMEAQKRGLIAAQFTWADRVALDASIESQSKDWPVHRQPAMDRAILRLAIWEMKQDTTPQAVVLEEAVRLAHEFGTAKSSGFVNAILDAIAHAPPLPPLEAAPEGDATEATVSEDESTSCDATDDVTPTADDDAPTNDVATADDAAPTDDVAPTA